ncbi:hypothetical protein [Bacteroides nordii]|uniref:hypothetical protein n=1 Tax=Bacteroides nordii TaxID=291645 RepID=UPI00189F7451|nr:hypothetical protein [Bacteroides nordii]
MPKKINTAQLEKQNRIIDFYKRWNIDLNEKERWHSFRNRVLNSYMKIGRAISYSSEMENEFFELIGIHKRPANIFDFNVLENELSKSPTYNYLFDTNDMKGFILGIQAVFWLKELTKAQKKYFLIGIQEAVSITGVPLGIKQTESEIIFYPEGAKLLDEKLINDNLDWLSAHPKSYETFKMSLMEIGIQGKERNVVDHLRLSLELLLKDIFNNGKSLENQKSDIGNYLKSKNISPEISNLLERVLDYYAKYQNNKAKHDCAVLSSEVEFILYLTGTVMRFLLTNQESHNLL